MIAKCAEWYNFFGTWAVLY